MTERQPLLHDEIVVLRAPTQAWSSRTGEIGGMPVHGIYHSDVRIVSSEQVTVDGQAGEHLAVATLGADTVAFHSLLRHLDDPTADPRVRATLTRSVFTNGASTTFTVESALARDIHTVVRVEIGSDLASMDGVKAGLPEKTVDMTVNGNTASWADGAISAMLTAPGARLAFRSSLTLEWEIVVPAHGSVEVGWSLDAADAKAVVLGAKGDAPWSVPVVADDRLRRWVARALDDLDALRMTTAEDPTAQFLAAGAPWFFTLFGRDSIWAARLMLPVDHRVAADTLRVLARLQGSVEVAATAEQPGKIMHELRRETLEIPGEGISLPPLYYGTVDATPLWVCLLYDAWKAGMPDAEVRDLLPHLEAALGWMRDYGDADGDGLLEYVDATGHGLSNQGWKDSGDSVQWRDGSLAEGPIALCEVQAYAYEAATHGADLLEHFGVAGDDWRAWAERLRSAFHASFWVSDAQGEYPAIALDARKRAVDSLTSNIGHLLGTGLLDHDQAVTVAARLVSPQLASGYGLRTMSTDSAGYWPLSYHGGSVWAHDTAIAIDGLRREGFAAEAVALANGLLAAAAAFDYRMPELHSGDPAGATATVIPYPAACRPQAWSAAAAIAVWSALER